MVSIGMLSMWQGTITFMCADCPATKQARKPLGGTRPYLRKKLKTKPFGKHNRVVPALRCLRWKFLR